MLLLRNAEGVGGAAAFELALSCGLVVRPMPDMPAGVVVGAAFNVNEGADVAADEPAAEVVALGTPKASGAAAAEDAAVEAGVV